LKGDNVLGKELIVSHKQMCEIVEHWIDSRTIYVGKNPIEKVSQSHHKSNTDFRIVFAATPPKED